MFKALMFGDIYVDPNLLGKGIYEANIPKLYSNIETIESLIDSIKSNCMYISDENFVLVYVENLKQCKLVDVDVIIK